MPWCSNNTNEIMQAIHYTKYQTNEPGERTKKWATTGNKSWLQNSSSPRRYLEHLLLLVPKVISSQAIVTKLALFFMGEKLLITLFWATKVEK